MQILLPQLGFSMSEGTLVKWLVDDGATVSEGDPLFSLEADKAVQDVEAPATGTVRILLGPGEDYPVGTVLGEII